MKEKANEHFAVKKLMEDVYGLCDCTPPSFLITGKEKNLLLDRKYGTAGLNQAVRYMISFPLHFVNPHELFGQTTGMRFILKGSALRLLKFRRTSQKTLACCKKKRNCFSEMRAFLKERKERSSNERSSGHLTSGYRTCMCTKAR